MADDDRPKRAVPPPTMAAMLNAAALFEARRANRKRPDAMAVRLLKRGAKPNATRQN